MSKEAEARQMARDGHGHENISVHLGFSEYDARCFVFGKGAAMAWLRRQMAQQGQRAEAS